MQKLGVLMLTVALAAGALAGCRGGDTAQDGAKGPKSDVGITKEPCPGSEHKDRGCIYLGIISDLTVGPFHVLAVPITDAQKAFWKRVNSQGGIGGYDVDAVTYVRDNKYNPQTHNEAYQEMKGKVLALAQSLGSPTTAAILPDMKTSNIIAAPAAWTSAYAFEDNILESGASYCIESMNAVDYAKETFGSKTVMAVHLAGDYGDDAAAGVKIAAAKLGLTFSNVKTDSGIDKQAGAVNAIVTGKPDLVILTTGPADAAAIVGGAAQRGFTGKFIGTSPSWNQGLLATAAAPALKALYLQSAPWKSWATDSPGHKAMREAVGSSVTPNDGYTAGWVWSYPLLAALKKAQADGDLTRAGVAKAAKSLTKVDYEGMLPDGAGNYAGGPDGIFRQSLIYNPTVGTGGVNEIKLVKDYFVGSVAKDYKLDKPCYETL